MPIISWVKKMSENEIGLTLDRTAQHQKMSDLSEAQISYALAFSKSIDVTNKVMVLQYGTEAQRKVRTLSESAHLNIPESDLNEIESLLKKMIRQLDAFEEETERTKYSSLSSDKAMEKFRSQYDAFNSKLTECARRLEILRSALLHHIDRMDRYYTDCMKIIREYDMYLLAGEACLKDQRSTRLPELAEKAKASSLMEDAIKVRDFSEACQLFEKKLADLALSRELPLQMMTQLKLIQATDTVMAANLRRLTMDIFPLYRSRIVMAIGVNNESVIDRQLFLDANDALRKAVNTVLKEENEKRQAQQKGIAMFRF